MHFHNPADNVSAMRYALHPDSLSVHPEAGCPASQAEALPEEPSFSDLRLDL